MEEEGKNMFTESAAGFALAASALAEAAQALSEAAATLSLISQESEPPSSFQSLERLEQVVENQETNNEDDSIQENSDDGSSSVGANTGNNAHRRDIGPGDSKTGDQYVFTPHREDPVPTASSSQAQNKPFAIQKQSDMGSLGGLFCRGRYYLVLEEEFDALPMILTYATARQTTICYVPTSGSLAPWESMISAIIPDGQVQSAISISGNSVIQSSEVFKYFALSNGHFVLVLCSTLVNWANEHRIHLVGDSVIFWGLPGLNFWPSVKEAIQQSQNALVILNHREYQDPTCRTFIAGLGSGVTLHPQQLELNSIKPDSLLASLRDNIQWKISKSQHSNDIQRIYEELLESPIGNTGHLRFQAQSLKERIDLVNKFVARVFLRGRPQDGRLRFTYDGKELPIPVRTQIRLEDIFRVQTQPDIDSTNHQPRSVSNGNNISQNSDTPTFVHRPGLWHITLQHEADTIPLISYLASQHPKSMCCISHTQSAFQYGDLFSAISTYEVIRSGKKLRSVEDALGSFSKQGLRSGLCILRGIASPSGNTSLKFQQARADALVYWGLPAQESHLWPQQSTQHQFTHVYLIIPPAQLSTVLNLTRSTFQEHPASSLLNGQGPESLLHLSREKARSALESMTRETIRDIAKFYKPPHPPAYPFWEFLRRVMLRTHY